VRRRRATRGTIGRQDEQRHEREIGFGHAGVQFGRRGATGHHDRYRRLAREDPPQREKTGAAFIDSYVDGQLGALGRGQRERGGSRSG